MPYFTCFGVLRMPYFTKSCCPLGKPPFDQEEAFISRRCYKAVKEKLEIL